jgi:hypothetical protein
LKRYSEILEPNKMTLPSFTINGKEWVSKTELIKRFMKINKKSHAQSYREFHNQCEHWETIKEGRKVFVSTKHKWEHIEQPMLSPEVKLSLTLEAIEKETDLDRFKTMCSILAKKHPVVFTQCLDESKKVLNNKEILNKIDKLQTELNKLRRELI